MDYRQLAKLFTSMNITKVAKGDLSYIYDIVSTFPAFEQVSTLQEIYEESYNLLCKYYPNEYVVKNTIANNILIGTHSMNTASMLSELRIGSNKADCVIINGISTCYEIKTQYDSLKRLPDQLATYNLAFDRVYVVIHAVHLESILKLHSENPTFGVILANERNNLSKKIIAPKVDGFDKSITFHTLRKEEYTDIFKSIMGLEPVFPDKNLFSECKNIFCELSQEEANKQFKRVLKKYRKNDKLFINQLPKSMKNLGISFDLTKRDKLNITSFLLEKGLLNKESNNVLSVYER